MSMDAAAIPRLRVQRDFQSTAYDYSGSIPGPSRFPGNASDVPNGPNTDDNDDDDDTPKLLSSSRLPSTSFSDLTEETPAARLKAVLSRVTNSSSKSVAPETTIPSSASTVDLDSEFEIPEIGSSMPSLAHESLKDLFSRALREPGDTPQKISKGRVRRNSIDTSEFESSPHVERVQKERSIAKGKRKSFSDDETDTNSVAMSSRISSASTFDSLRERLLSSSQQAKQPFPRDEGDTVKFPNDFDSSPPAATSTPLHSLRISVNTQFDSNLMDQDSEMQKAMAGADSLDEIYAPRTSSQPSPKQSPFDKNATIKQKSHPNVSRSQPISAHSSYSSRNHNEKSHLSVAQSDKSSLRRSHSDISSANAHTREREWNKHHPTSRSNTPDLKHHRQSSGGQMSPMSTRLSRKDSNASLVSIESGRLSRADSVRSQGEYKDEKEKEHNHELERQWNKPPPRIQSRPSSTVGFPAPSPRSRTNSTPSRPDSRMSIHSRHNSHSSYSSSSSRASSPNGSLRSSGGEKEQEEEGQAEVNHERERNWNSPHPVWHKHSSIHHPPSRSSSPLPPSPSPTPSFSGLSPHTRIRAESLRALKSPSLHSLHDTPTKSPGGRSSSFSRSTVASESKASPHHSHNRRPSTTSHHIENSPNRLSSPIPSVKEKLKKAEKSLPFPRSHTAPVSDSVRSDLKRQSRTVSSPSPSPRLSFHRNSELSSNKTSHIPIWTPSSKSKQGKTLFPSPSPKEEDSSPYVPSVVLSVPMEETLDDYPKDVMTETDQEDDGVALEKTPTLRTTLSLPSESSPPPRSTLNDEERLSKLIASPPSPPLSPSSDPSEDISAPSTPPRRASFSSSKLEFQTPSPPKGGLPDLPAPPSETSEDDTEDHTPIRMNGNLSNIKTPKPPGAWLTPAPNRQNGLLRAQSLPEEETSTESGLVTPVASLSRAYSLPPQTPALPGGWMATPARKSVRFDEDLSMETETSVIETSTDSRPDFSPLTLETKSMPEPEVATFVDTQRSDFPPSVSEPISPAPSPQRTKAAIRMVDEFGRERTTETLEKKPVIRESPRKNNSTIRIVDSMGRAIEDSVSVLEEQPSELDDLPLTRLQALERLRRGLSELSQGIDSQNHNDSRDHQDQVKRLDEKSQVSREKRQRLLAGLREAEAEMKSKFAASRLKGGSIPVTYGTRTVLQSWIFWVIIQIVIIIVMWRKADAEARRLYMTRYYDPFYSDLYALPDAQSCSSMSATEMFWQRGFLAAIANVVQCWSGWYGPDDTSVRSGSSWPLT